MSSLSMPSIRTFCLSLSVAICLAALVLADAPLKVNCEYEEFTLIDLRESLGVNRASHIRVFREPYWYYQPNQLLYGALKSYLL